MALRTISGPLYESPSPGLCSKTLLCFYASSLLLYLCPFGLKLLVEPGPGSGTQITLGSPRCM